MLSVTPEMYFPPRKLVPYSFHRCGSSRSSEIAQQQKTILQSQGSCKGSGHSSGADSRGAIRIIHNPYIPSADTHLLVVHAAEEQPAVQFWLRSVILRAATGPKHWHENMFRHSASKQNSNIPRSKPNIPHHLKAQQVRTPRPYFPCKP